jgi:hypothetical protein
MHPSLPFDANFEAIRKEARELLRDLKQDNITATVRYRPFDVLDIPSNASLVDAQYVVARHYGFRSWADLENHLIENRKDV